MSVFGAVGTVLGTRALLKEAIEWITKQWHKSPKRRLALMIIAYIIQSIIGIAGLLGIVASAVFSHFFMKFGGSSAALTVLLVIALLLFAKALFCWIGATVVFCQNVCCKPKKKGSVAENSGEYVLLTEKE